MVTYPLTRFVDGEQHAALKHNALIDAICDLDTGHDHDGVNSKLIAYLLDPKNVAATAATGSATTYARGDHVHKIGDDIIDINHLDAAIFSASNPADVAGEAVVGSGEYLSRNDHVHRGVGQLIQGDGIEISPASGRGAVTITATGLTGGTGFKPILSPLRSFSEDEWGTYDDYMFVDHLGQVWGGYRTKDAYGEGACSLWVKTYTYKFKCFETTSTFEYTITRTLTSNGSCSAGPWSEPGPLASTGMYMACGTTGRLYGIFDKYGGGQNIKYLGKMGALTPTAATIVYDGVEYSPDRLAIVGPSSIRFTDGQHIYHVTGTDAATRYRTSPGYAGAIAAHAEEFIIYYDDYRHYWYHSCEDDYTDYLLFELTPTGIYDSIVDSLHTDHMEQKAAIAGYVGNNKGAIHTFNFPQLSGL